MKGLILILFVSLCGFSYATASKAFISFSMPQKAIDAIAKDAQRLNVSLYLNGLIDNDMKKTMVKIFSLSQKYPNLSIQIDPPSFEKYGINKVPAFVVDYGADFDVFFGNYHIEDALSYLSHQRRG